MKPLIVCYSHSGNNALLAGHLGRMLDAPVTHVVEKHKRSGWTILLDMFCRRRPAIQPIGMSPRAFDVVLLVAPLWNMHVAHPMQTAIAQMRGELGRFAFASLCGYQRPGQAAHVSGELVRLAGRAPGRVWTLPVSDLLAPVDRSKVRVVSAHRVVEDELAVFRAQVEEIVAFLR